MSIDKDLVDFNLFEVRNLRELVRAIQKLVEDWVQKLAMGFLFHTHNSTMGQRWEHHNHYTYRLIRAYHIQSFHNDILQRTDDQSTCNQHHSMLHYKQLMYENIHRFDEAKLYQSHPRNIQHTCIAIHLKQCAGARRISPGVWFLRSSRLVYNFPSLFVLLTYFLSFSKKEIRM